MAQEPPEYGAEERKPQAQADAGKIKLSVKFPDGTDLTFAVRATTLFEKIMDSISSQKGVDKRSFKLLYEGTRVNKEETPKMLEMEDGDILEFFQEQLGGGQSARR